MKAKKLVSPDFAWLCLKGGIAKQQSFQGFSVKWVQWPKITFMPEGGSCGNRDCNKNHAGQKTPQSSDGRGNDQKHPVNPEAVSEINAGKGERGQQSHRGVK